jgi:hypothetical protein
VEESPEQVLARLARHRDAVFRARGLPVPGPNAPPAPPRGASGTVTRPSRAVATAGPAVAAAPPVGAWGSTRPTPTEFLPPGLRGDDGGWSLGQSAVLVTIFGLVLAVVSSAAAVLAFEELSSTVAFAIVGVMVLAGLVATAKRVPTALWFTVGAAVGGILGRWS